MLFHHRFQNWVSIKALKHFLFFPQTLLTHFLTKAHCLRHTNKFNVDLPYPLFLFLLCLQKLKAMIISATIGNSTPAIIPALKSR